MDFEKIKELIKLVDSSSLAFFELETGNDHIKMDKSLNRGVNDSNSGKLNNAVAASSVNTGNVVVPVNSVEKSEVYSAEEETKIEKEAPIDDANLSIITSPMVGTYYSSASPESPAFIEVGGTVSKGKVVCIIEAMKLMNEIESDYSGTVIECLAKDGDMVEYGQPLFKIKGE